MTTDDYAAPIGEQLLRSGEASLAFTRSLTGHLVGGPTRVVDGTLYLTSATFAFRAAPNLEIAQHFTAELSTIDHPRVERQWLWGLIPRGKRLVVDFHIHNRQFPLRFSVADPAEWARAIDQALDNLGERAAPSERLDQALADGVCQPARYVTTLLELSFPQAVWHVEDDVALESILVAVLGQLGAADYLPGPDFYRRLVEEVAVDAEFAPEDDDPEEYLARREQIAGLMSRINDALAPQCDRRFYQFAEDLPGWEADEPVWLFLTEKQRERLLELGVVHPVGA